MRWCRPKSAPVVVKRAAQQPLTVHDSGRDAQRADEPCGDCRASQGTIAFKLSWAHQVCVHTEPTDMCRPFNKLSALVTEEMVRQALGGELLVFISKDRKRAKVLHFDGTGLIVWSKRLDRGRVAPVDGKKLQGGLELRPSECALLLEGNERADQYGLSPPPRRHRDPSSCMKQRGFLFLDRASVLVRTARRRWLT